MIEALSTAIHAGDDAGYVPPFPANFASRNPLSMESQCLPLD
jgi:hypothetical protein